MSDIKIPTIGRMVHYFPNDGDKHTAANTATCLPATVVQPFGERINLMVTCMNPDGPVVLRYSVQHKSSIPKKENSEELQTGQAYWDWPEVK